MPQSTNPPLPPEELARLHLHGFFEESDGDLHESWSAGRPSPSLGPKPSLPSRAAQDLENLTQYLETRTERSSRTLHLRADDPPARHLSREALAEDLGTDGADEVMPPAVLVDLARVPLDDDLVHFPQPARSQPVAS